DYSDDDVFGTSHGSPHKKAKADEVGCPRRLDCLPRRPCTARTCRALTGAALTGLAALCPHHGINRVAAVCPMLASTMRHLNAIPGAHRFVRPPPADFLPTDRAKAKAAASSA